MGEESAQVPPPGDAWTKRYDAIGAVQRRYLFLLLLLGVFFIALHQKIQTIGPEEATVKVPVVGVEIQARLIWVFSPCVILLILLAYLGALQAATRAKDNSDHDRMEPYDLHPTIVDMIVYTLEPLPFPFNIVSAASYPLVLLTFLAEAWFLQVAVLRSVWGLDTLVQTSFTITGVLSMISAKRLAWFIWRRGRDFLQSRHDRVDSALGATASGDVANEDRRIRSRIDVSDHTESDPSL